MQDRRQSFRRKTFLGGRVVFNHRQATMDCVLKNVGGSGAKLVFNNTASVPDEFDVQVARMERTFRARVEWRRQDELGVSFVEHRASSNVVPLDLAIKMRKLESENARLQRRVTQLSTGDY
jgi:hypothetical protein